jgi:hypothetical protein
MRGTATAVHLVTVRGSGQISGKICPNPGKPIAVNRQIDLVI